MEPMNEKLLAILRGALIAAVGAGGAYLIAELGMLDYGPATPLVTASLAVLANALRKLGSGAGKVSLFVLAGLVAPARSTDACWGAKRAELEKQTLVLQEQLNEQRSQTRELVRLNAFLDGLTAARPAGPPPSLPDLGAFPRVPQVVPIMVPSLPQSPQTLPPPGTPPYSVPDPGPPDYAWPIPGPAPYSTPGPIRPPYALPAPELPPYSVPPTVGRGPGRSPEPVVPSPNGPSAREPMIPAEPQVPQPAVPNHLVPPTVELRALRSTIAHPRWMPVPLASYK